MAMRSSAENPRAPRSFVVTVVAAVFATGCWVTAEQGELLRRDVHSVTKRLDSLEKTLERDRARLSDAVMSAETDLKRLDEILKAATKLLAKEGAGLGVRVDDIERDMGSLTGTADETRVKLDALRDDFLSAIDRLDALDKALRDLGAKVEEVASKPRLPDDPGDLFTLALKRLGAGATGEGREMLREYTKRAPKGPHVEEARFRIADSYLAESEWEKAIRDFRGFLETYAESERAGEAWFGIGRSLFELGDCKKATAFLNKVQSDYKKLPVAKKAKALAKTVRTTGKKKCVD